MKKKKEKKDRRAWEKGKEGRKYNEMKNNSLKRGQGN
jgi:hypothetical protein